MTTTLWGSLFLGEHDQIRVKRGEFEGRWTTAVHLGSATIHLDDEQALVLSQLLAEVENDIVTPPRAAPPPSRPWHNVRMAAVAPGDVIWRDGEWAQVTAKLPDFDTVWLTFGDGVQLELAKDDLAMKADG